MNKIHMIQEALARLEMLEKMFGTNPNIKKYLKDGKLYYSYITAGGYMGSIDTIGYDKRYQSIVETFEKESGCFVYHVIEHEDTIALLFVSDAQESWEKERPQKASVLAYVVDVNRLESERGYIKLDALQGALRRRSSEVLASLPQGRNDETGMSEVEGEVVKRLNILKALGIQTDLDIAEIYRSEGQICFSELRSVLGRDIYLVNRLEANEIYQKCVTLLSAQLPMTLYFMMVMSDGKMAFLFVDEEKETWSLEKLMLKKGHADAIVLDLDKLVATMQNVNIEIVNGGPLCTM